RIMQVTLQVGATAFRDNYFWSGVEVSSKGQYSPGPSLRLLETFVRDAKARGIEPILILCYGNPFYNNYKFQTSADARAAFVNYAKFVATKFKGVVRNFEVWNEWNIGAMNRSSERYGD